MYFFKIVTLKVYQKSVVLINYDYSKVVLFLKLKTFFTQKEKHLKKNSECNFR